MVTLRTVPVTSASGATGGEVFACAYAPDGGAVLSAGWDGVLRLWQTGQDGQPGELRAGTYGLTRSRGEGAVTG